MLTQEQDIVKIPKAKRVFDVLFSFLIILILSPVLILITGIILIEGILIKSSRGPIFYKETRISQGKPFILRKFRIFKVSAYKPILDSGNIVHTKPLEKNPDNLTNFGKILKKFYLDESPQIFNVLLGEMTFIGTRPWNPVDYQKEIEKGILRKKIMKAGITGPVQIHKKNAALFGGEHKLDNDYINFVKENHGIKVVALDIKLLIQSALFMIKGEGL